MLGYAKLGDRHLENLLIDATSGAAMHVDFGCLFDHGLNLEHPERVPFRLTQNLIHAMGVTGVEGVFRRVCELTLEQLRTHREALLDVIGTLRHDPLVDWRKRNAQEDESGVKDSAEATKELKKIDSKLNGIIESRGPTPLTVSGQVQALIAEATDINNLSQMYIWWYAARRSGLRALRAQASRAPCAQANEPRLRPRQDAVVLIDDLAENGLDADDEQ